MYTPGVVRNPALNGNKPLKPERNQYYVEWIYTDAKMAGTWVSAASKLICQAGLC